MSFGGIAHRRKKGKNRRHRKKGSWFEHKNVQIIIKVRGLRDYAGGATVWKGLPKVRMKK